MGGITNLGRQEEQKEQESRSQNAKCKVQEEDGEDYCNHVKDSHKLINLTSQKMCIENVLLIFDI